MAGRRKTSDPEEIRRQLSALLEHFEIELKNEDLRSKVLALVPVHNLLRDLGSSLLPVECSTAARDRILFYFRKYPGVVLSGEELMIVAGISEWARRLRELRVQFGWAIVSGTTAKEMAEEEDFGIDVSAMKPDDYFLSDKVQDREAALRWNNANLIRNKTTSIQDRILEFLKLNVGKHVTGEELRYVAKDKTEWARRVRELRTEQGWQIMTKTTGMPDLPVGVYVLANPRQAPVHDRKIPDPVRREVLKRDAYRCQYEGCGWHSKLWDPSDPRHLEAHHIKQHAHGGENTAENLITYCNICHDHVHRKH